MVRPDCVGRASNVPFVEIPMSSMPGTERSISKKERTSRRVSGSPPVIRTFDTPNSVAMRISRSVSS